MPEFNDAQQVEQLCYELVLGDYPRRVNRARINELFNGHPPYTNQEVEENGIVVNVNSLEGTGLAHDARSQFYGAFLKPGVYFRLTTDMGTPHKRAERATIVTREINKVMKRSLPYFECYRSKFALNVLHGIGPAVWENADSWCPDPMGIDDVLIPGKTLLTMKNLPLFAIYHSFTARELIKLTRGPRVDPGWNMELVEEAIRWIDNETLKLMGDTWPEVWSPEKLEERIKGDGGFYPGDTAPTLDCFDFYFWSDDGDQSGWKRRIILDSWGAPAAGGMNPLGGQTYKMNRKSDSLHSKKNGFLYNGGDRIFADRREQLVSFQFADLSSVAPFQYHSVRSLGFLLYSVCHLQNRMRCKFAESVFEALLNYFRIKNADDFQRALKVQLANKGFIDDTIEFVKAGDRWEVNAELVQLGLEQNQGLINKHSSSFTMNPDRTGEKRELTATQFIGEAQNTTQLVSAALNQAYMYQTFEDYEIVRRFFKKRSRDPEVNIVQAACLRQGVPEEMLIAEAWECEHERVMGAGNMNLEMAIANWLMANREKYDPDAQREILRKSTFSVTSDPGLTEMLVPEKKVLSDSTHDAQLSAASLLMGLSVGLKQGVNHQEYAQALLAAMFQEIQRITQKGNVADVRELAGLQNLAGQTIQGAPLPGNGIRSHIEVLAENPNEKELVKKLGDQLGKLMNLVKAFAQRLQQQQQEVQASGAPPDPREIAKAQAIQMQAKIKAQNASQSHAQKTAQRQITFEQKTRQDAEKHQADLAATAREHATELQATSLEHAHNMARQKMSSMAEEED